MVEKKKEKRSIIGILLSAVLFAAVLCIFWLGVSFFSAKADEKGADTLRRGISRASVQCYAIEGRYPPSVAYLEENYGIQIDESRYNVFYSGFASNIMPEITVIPVKKESGGGWDGK
ncbi:hypothetical protein C0033_06510 [Clostridium sp. chh4-2]|uniref:hypothetical protein n=1 Tax=Clostridium sp. chh4-2 TaxID=2067550 RepID=UPI000CCEBE05|nr:hypothetical protein [Clostridium sp. chh4-2]PNV62680.1 hypothetical protein C0033_06510 [Clostridium sp. chh4-2]